MNDTQPPGNQRIGKWMIFAAWLLGFAMLLLYFNDFLEQEKNPNQSVYSRVDDAGNSEVILQRNRYGHYVTNGKINGIPVTFMLDTGATDVAIPENVANKLGLIKGAQKQYRTANGIVTAHATMLDVVAIGPLQVKDVRASINPGLKGKEVLLGMSVLKHIEFSQRDDTLILKSYN